MAAKLRPRFLTRKTRAQAMNKRTLGQRVMQYVADARFMSDARRLELYPPFFLMRVKVLEVSADWRHLRIRLPLNTFSRNPGGVMFGGYQAAVADPIAALACARIFPGYSVWTRAMCIDFERGGSTDLELRFDLPAQLEADVRRELETAGRATPTFEYGYYLGDGTRCSVVRNTVAIRPKGYRKATTPPAPERGL
jgi:acyl-coenzyme A thioesterase PaaI-like protein